MNNAPACPSSTRIVVVDATATSGCGVDEGRLRARGAALDRHRIKPVLIDARREVRADADPVAARDA